jgi:hypothetical protein
VYLTGLDKGGVLSPKLFSVYVDDLSLILNGSAVGVSIDGQRMNHFPFADDMAVCAPTGQGASKLLKLCETYAVEHDMVFNAKKTVCMVVRPKTLSDLKSVDIWLNGNVLSYVTSYKYLGVLLTASMNDDADMMRQMRSLYARANVLLRKFSNCSFEVKRLLFQTFCVNMYCAQLWCNYTVQCFRKLKVAYNNCLRRFLGYSRYCSASGMFVTNGINSFDEILRKYVYSFRNRVGLSQNMLVKAVRNSSTLWATGIHREWMARLYVRGLQFT